MGSPFDFLRSGQSGLPVSHLFTKTAEHIDDLAIIRSMQADVPNHEPSLMLMNCGDGRLPRPSFGAWATYGLGSENQNLPGFIAMYGEGTHARQLLITRRLIERGVRFVQVWSGAGQPWDNHNDLRAEHSKLAGQWDQPIAAFLTDLKQRGLFDETLVLWGGEFGRTPTAEYPALTGRDHNHYGFTCWLAGGGVKGGIAYGATDEFGFRAVEKPVHVHDLHATMLHLLGFDHQRLTYRFAGRDFRLTDVHGRVIHDLLA